MRGILCFSLLFFLSCNVKKANIKIDNCNEQRINVFQKLVKHVEFDSLKIGTLDLSEIQLPQKYDTLKWFDGTGYISELNELYTKNMIYRTWFDSLLALKCENSLLASDFLNHYGEPSSITDTELIYRFNNEHNPNCFDDDSSPLWSSSQCSLLIVIFDSSYVVKDINSYFLTP